MSSRSRCRPARGHAETPRYLKRLALAAGLAVFLFFAYITAARLAYAMIYCTVLVLSVSWLWTRIADRGLNITRTGPEGAHFVGDAFLETIDVANRAVLSLPSIEIIDRSEIPGHDVGKPLSLGPRQARRWRVEGWFSSRGRFRMGPLDVVTGDPFGIFQRRRVVWPATTVTVYPRLLEVSQFLPDAAHTVGDASVQGHYIDAPPDALGVRDHDASDGFNRIHWPSTARLGRLMSRTFERYEGSDILVLLDLDRSVHHGEGPDSSLERAMSLAASLVHAAIVRSQAVGLVANNRDAATFPPARGGEQLARILDFLAEARADGGSATFPRLKAAALTYSPDAMLIITPRPAGRWLEQLVAVDGRRGRARATVLHLNGQAREESAAPPTAAFARWWELGPNDPVFASAPGPTRGASTRLSVAS